MYDLKPSQIEAALLLASGKTGREVASALKCTPETVSHWRHQPTFEAFLNELRFQHLDATRETLRSAGLEAAKGLLDILRNAKSEETRRRACKDVLELLGIGSPESWGWAIGSCDPDKL